MRPPESSVAGIKPLPPALFSWNPLAWLAVFGPGAILASLTIGTGELIFSARGGALFGYRVLFIFVLICVLKWVLVFTSARHMVLTGVHPFQRMMDLPGPRGWFPMALLILAAVAYPIWTSFHCGVLGDLMAWVTGTKAYLGGAMDYLWGAAILAGTLVLSLAGGYGAMERIQLAIITAMLLCVGITLVLYNPDWLEMLRGAVIPQALEYPVWLEKEYPRIAAQPVWVETTRYAGVIAGAGYDYLAYTSFLRDKQWGRAGLEPATSANLELMARDRFHPVRLWVRAPLIDCTLSFLCVIGFSAVFVACGALVLGPEHKVPDDKSYLNLQADFVRGIHPWLLPLYVLGAFLTMFGTLYGTLEVAHSNLRELAHSVSPELATRRAKGVKVLAVTWCAAGAFGVLGWSFVRQLRGGEDTLPKLLAILTPVNLFTGVVCCGLLCLLNLWMDRRFLPGALRMPRWLLVLNAAAGVIFILLGLKGYWDWSRSL